MDWMKIALALPVSHSNRLNCWKCGGKNSASVTNMGNRYVVFCFKCKETDTAKPPAMTAAERLTIRKAAEAFERAEPSLPDDFTTDIPMAGLIWLTKGGLHVNDIKRHGFGWSDTLRRVVMPVYDNGTLVGTQARRVDPEGYGPKYLGQVWSGPRPVWKSDTNSGETLVLTEDILSAARVGKVCTAWSLLGTNLMDAVINRIASSEYTDIAVWMDDDEAGIAARRKMLRQLGGVGIQARAIHSDRDPKMHTINEMKELLWPRRNL